MGNNCEIADEKPKNSLIGKKMRTNEDVVCEISYEMRELSYRLENVI